MLAAALAPIAVGTGTAEAAAPTSAATEAKAVRLAAANGVRVEVQDKTTERSQTFAEPNGTFTTEISTTVQRVRRDGGWTPVDTTLAVRSDGRIAPRAAATDIAFSAGGTGPFARLASGGGALELSAPWRLPAPSLSGSTATYTDVLPGVDLVARVAAEGFTYNLVVKNRQAAGNAALRSLRFAVSSPGLGLRTDASNRARYVDATGRLVLSVGETVMWDSGGSAAAGKRSSTAAVENIPAGARVAGMDLRADARSLTVVPDTAMLTAPDTVYPVVIDPAPVTVDKTSWTAAWELYPDMSFFKTQHSLGVGYEGYSQFKRVRSFFQFTIPTTLFGKQITGAEFRTHETHSASCTAREVTVSRTNPITTSTTWNNQPAWQADVAKKNFAYGWSSDCAARDVGFDVTGSIQYTVAHNSRTTTLRMRASNETDPLGWKQFDSTGKLSVTYVSKPTTPTGLSAAEQAGYPLQNCGTEADPAIFSRQRPQLSAVPRGGDADRDVRVRFEAYNSNNSLWTLMSGNTLPNVRVSRQFDNEIANGIYRYRARTEYTYDGSSTLYSGWTGWCYFRIDTTRPATPTVTATYNGVALDNCMVVEVGETCPMQVPFGGVVTYKVTASPSSPDVVKTWYYWRGDEHVIAGRDLTVSLQTPAQGLVTFTARSVDGAGLQSASAFFRINVGPPPGPVGTWTFDSASGSVVPDTGSSPHPMTLASGAQLATRGRMAGSVSLDGVDDSASTAAPAVDTSKSFSVAAWVRSVDAGEGGVVSAEGSRGSGFRLYRMSSDGRWAFGREQTDTDAAAITRAVSDQPSVYGAWSHVAGVFDASAKTMTLYVNGRMQGSPVPYTGTAWKANGPLSIGRYKAGGSNVGFFAGSIDQLQVWSRTLPASEVLKLTDPRVNGQDKTTAGEAAYLPLDGSFTTDTTNWYTSDYAFGASMQLTGFAAPSAAFVADPSEQRGTVLGMTSSTGLVLRRPVVDVGTSYTVAAWVQLADNAPAGTILRQAGANADLWSLSYRPTAGDEGEFVFSRSKEDSASEPVVAVAGVVDRVAASTGWNLLVGTYDASTNRISLRLETKEQGDDAVTAGVHRTSSTVAGKAERAGTTGFAGLLDDIHIYAGVKPDGEICGELMGGDSCEN